MSFTQDDIQPCAVCRKGIMHAGLPLFYKVTVTRLGIDARAVQRQSGLEQMLGGNAAIARALSPNDELAQVMNGPRTIIICELCTHEHPILMQVFFNEDANG